MFASIKNYDANDADDWTGFSDNFSFFVNASAIGNSFWWGKHASLKLYFCLIIL